MATGLAAAAAEFGRQVVPGDAGLEDEQDAGEDLAVVQRLAAGEAEAAGRRRRHQRLHAFPKGIGDKRFHGSLSGQGGRSLIPTETAGVPIGSFFPNALSNAVDIYDASTGLWSTAALSQARYDLVAATVGTKAIFAGGTNSDAANDNTSNVVDI